MNKKKLTMADFYEKIHPEFGQKSEKIDIIGFIDYCETFNIDLFSKEFFEDPNGEYLNIDREIKQNLITFFKPKKKEILVYRYDYYTNKTVEEIAIIIDRDVHRVIAYFERIKNTLEHAKISGLSKYGDVIKGTRIEKFSSFKILKELQLIERQLSLSKLRNERLKKL
jgi:adenine-specific DNA methylase